MNRRPFAYEANALTAELLRQKSHRLKVYLHNPRGQDTAFGILVRPTRWLGITLNSTMKVKHSPADFHVEELTDFPIGDSGPFTVYRLEKTGWTTPDAIGRIAREWRVDPSRIGYGGLKDRHAVTIQFLTIARGPADNLDLDAIKLQYLGQSYDPFMSQHIRANRFAIVLRDVSKAELSRAEVASQELAKYGVPNYFDDQRFGSTSTRENFVAREMVRGRYEEALKLALILPYEFDKPEEKREKQLLQNLWGQWPAAKTALSKSHARSLVDFLIQRPGDFKGACARLRPDLRGLYLSAYQSDLWNRFLHNWLMQNIPQEDQLTVELKLGHHVVPRSVPAKLLKTWEVLQLPLPSHRLKADEKDFWWPALDKVLKEEGLSLSDIKIRGMEKPFFSKGERAACLKPEQLSMLPEPDEKHPSKQKLTLKFELPRGCYATMIIKRLVQCGE